MIISAISRKALPLSHEVGRDRGPLRHHRKINLLAERTLAMYTPTRTSLNTNIFRAPFALLQADDTAPLHSQFVMTSPLPNTDILPPSTIELLNVVTQFSAELGTMTDLATLGNYIIQELCRAGATTHGALYLLDREHECYRRISIVGPVASTLIPPMLAAGHRCCPTTS